MPPFPGEETLCTVFVDVHSYFDTPSRRPFLHRFDKASYFYVYYNSTRHTSRIEIALHPGTPDQAAFHGFLDSVKVINTLRFPTQVTLVVDADTQSNSSPSSARGRDPDEWRLASADPRDPGTTKYKLHTIDFYFWTLEDAKLVLDICKKLLEPHQLDIEEDHSHPPHHDAISPVVQNLENVAISDPAYHKPKQQDPADLHTQNIQLPPPPPPPTNLQSLAGSHGQPYPPVAASAGGGVQSSETPAQPDHNYAPLAYNPAAPAAPEPIAHREDTPPPPDGAEGTGLSAAVHDNRYQQHQQQQYGALPPGTQQSPYGQYGSPPAQSFGPPTISPPPPSFGPNAASSQPSFGPQTVAPQHISPRTSVSTTFGAPPSATSPNESRHSSVAAQTYAPGGNDPKAHIFGQPPPVQTPGTQFYQSVGGQPHKPLQHVQPQYPDYLASGQAAQAVPQGRYSNYQYGQAPQQQPSATAGNPYDVHSQFYRPTEAEHQTNYHSRPSRTSSSSQKQKPSNAEKLEKGVGRLFKKIEKKIG